MQLSATVGQDMTMVRQAEVRGPNKDQSFCFVKNFQGPFSNEIWSQSFAITNRIVPN